MADKLPGYHVVRSGPPRILRSPMTGTWYVVSPPYRERDADARYLIASRKREVHPVEQESLEFMYERAARWTRPDAVDRVVAALEEVDRRIQAAAGADANLFNEGDDAGRREYAEAILEELRQ